MLIRKIRAPVVQMGSTRHKKWRRFSFSMSDVSNHVPRNVGSRSWPNWSKKTDSSAPLLTTRKITFSAKSHFSQMCRTEQLLLLSTSLRIYRKKSWSSNGSLCLWYNFAWNRKNLLRSRKFPSELRKCVFQLSSLGMSNKAWADQIIQQKCWSVDNKAKRNWKHNKKPDVFSLACCLQSPPHGNGLGTSLKQLPSFVFFYS